MLLIYILLKEEKCITMRNKTRGMGTLRFSRLMNYMMLQYEYNMLCVNTVGCSETVHLTIL